MKVSEITLQQMKDYMRVDYDDDDHLIMSIMLGVQSYIKSDTGLTAEQIDGKPDITIAYQVLVNEMHSNRQLTVSKSNINYVVDRILSMHAVNLL